jgi:DNA replication protein DnaC
MKISNERLVPRTGFSVSMIFALFNKADVSRSSSKGSIEDYFLNKLLGAAILDRIRHNDCQLILEGESYRKTKTRK